MARTMGATGGDVPRIPSQQHHQAKGRGQHQGVGGEEAAARVDERVEQVRVGEAHERGAMQPLVRHQQGPPEHDLPGQDLG
jgi:hypothetical protein